ncbi:MAG: APC family permease [Emcibacter sp.]|nr:APC family permease [Emcibacter sp.]
MNNILKTGRLRRDINILGVSFLVLNGLIGAAIFALPATLHEKAGLFSPWLFILISLLFITIILCFSELSSYFKESGGPVLYSYTAFGSIVGFQTGLFLYIARMAAMAANINVIIYYAAFFIPNLADGWIRIAIIIALLSSLAISNILGIKSAIRILSFLSTLKLLPLLILILVGLPYVSPSEVISLDFPKIDNMGATALILIYAFMGFEGALVTAGETDNPRKNLPHALIFTVMAITLLYFFIQLVYSSVAPEVITNKPLIELGKILLGSTGAIIITLAAIFSIAGNLMGNMITTPRMTYAMAEERTLPQWFGKLHSKYDTPANSIIFYTIICAALAISGSFIWLAILSSLARLVMYIICIAAIPVLRRKMDPETLAQAQLVPMGYVILPIALILCLWIASYSPSDAWYSLIALISLGTVLYWFARQRE